MNPWARAFRRMMSQPAYVVAAVVLAVSAITLNGAVGYMRLHFKKLPAPLAVKSLKQGLPAQLGDHWVQISKDQPLDPQVEEVLATGEYVFRDYADTRIISKEEIEQLHEASGGQYAALLAGYELRHPQAVIRAAVTYYTGMVDTVAHVPDRCYVADGYEATEYTEIDKTAGQLPNGSPRKITFRFISFEDQSGNQRVSRNVAYVFHVDGVYDCNPLGVHTRLQNLLEPYGYYAKVELMTQAPFNHTQDKNERDESIVAMTDFFTAALPSVEKCLPDWKALHEAKTNK